VNTDAPWPTLEEAEARVLEIQAKLHGWATGEPDRRFDDLFNLVADPAFLVVAWKRVRGNRGARTAGVDGVKPSDVIFGGDTLLPLLRAELKAGTFVPLPVRERMIPKAPGKFRRLGIPSARDRCVQASLKLVLEPIFEADFYPSSYGFRPSRRAQDAITEIHQLAIHSYEWVLEGDIEACFDRIDHTALMDRVRRRIGDRRLLRLVKAFLMAGVLSEDGVSRDTWTGTPQGGILSPLLANIALSALDEYFAEAWRQFGSPSSRSTRRRNGRPTYRLVRYADDFVVMVAGTKAHAAELREEVTAVLSTVGLVLSEEKTRECHIDEGFDFLGFRIQRQPQRGSKKLYVYTFPSKKALASVKSKVKAASRTSTNQTLADLIGRLNPILRGWTSYFRYASSKATFAYLRHYTWNRVVQWLRRKHGRNGWKNLRRRYFSTTWWPEQNGTVLFDPSAVAVTRCRWRGYYIARPWDQEINATA
jgi:RNA-directed DNA polymerase